MPTVLQVRIGNLGQTFGTYAGLAARGAIYEITQSRKVVAFLQASQGAYEVLKSVSEVEASRQARYLAEEASRENRAIQVNRLGQAPVYFVPPSQK